MQPNVIRNKNWKRQPEYDNLLKELSYSELEFLRCKYHRELQLFPKSNDINVPENFSEYKLMQQRWNWINEELERKNHDEALLDSGDIHTDVSGQYVVSQYNDRENDVQAVAFIAGSTEVMQTSADDYDG